GRKSDGALPWRNSTIPALRPAILIRRFAGRPTLRSPSLRSPSLRPTRDSLGHAPADSLAAMIGQGLARAELIDGHRRVELDHHLDPAQPGEMPEMGGQLHIAIPGQKRAQRPAE